MLLRDLFPHSFKSLRKQLNIPGPSKRGLVDQCRADDSEVCLETMAEPYSLSEDQMRHAADRYRLGKSRSGKTIYWMIDELGLVHDGHIGSSWVSQMLKSRCPKLHWQVTHCLFGQHLLFETEGTEGTERAAPNHAVAKTVCVVESERSAVILSEIYPQSLWMAYGYPANFNERLLEPLQGHRVVLYPNADETGNNYLDFLVIADQARRRYHLDITVSCVLEDKASSSQKSHQIDLLNYWVESIRNKASIHPE